MYLIIHLSDNDTCYADTTRCKFLGKVLIKSLLVCDWFLNAKIVIISPENSAIPSVSCSLFSGFFVKFSFHYHHTDNMLWKWQNYSCEANTRQAQTFMTAGIQIQRNENERLTLYLLNHHAVAYFDGRNISMAYEQSTLQSWTIH